MNKKWRVGMAAILTVALVLTQGLPAAAKKKVALSKKKISLEKGKQKKLSLKNADKKVKWSIKTGKKYIKLKSKQRNRVTVVAKAAGSAKVQAKLGKKKYICKVIVKNKASQKNPAPASTSGSTTTPATTPSAVPTAGVTPLPSAAPTATGAPVQDTETPVPAKTKTPPAEKDKKQVKALKALIQSVTEHTNVDSEPMTEPTREPELDDDGNPIEKEPTRAVSQDVDDGDQYTWTDGKLTEIIWNDTGITGALTLDEFPDLQTFVCSNNNITYLDLSGNPELNNLKCADNNLTSSKFTINNCKKLMLLDCSYNSLGKLNVSKMPELEQLNCSYNLLKKLDLTDNNKLVEIDCSENPEMSTLKIEETDEAGSSAGHPDLLSVLCVNCSISSIKLTASPALETLVCNDNTISKLNLKNNPALKRLECISNDLSVLDTGENTELEILKCSSNGYMAQDDTAVTFAADDEEEEEEDQILQMDVTKNVKLKTLFCAENALPTLDVSRNTALERLDCSNNRLKELDVSQNTELIFLNCRFNDITKLDLTNLKKYLSSMMLYCDTTVKVIGNKEEKK